MRRVDVPGAVTAHALDRQVLDGAKQLGLRGHRQVGDLVEEQRAAVGVLELAPAATHPGRRALFDAEQFGFDQRFDERGAIDRHERSEPPAPQLVNLPRHQLFADAAFAVDQHGEVSRRRRARPALEGGP